MLGVQHMHRFHLYNLSVIPENILVSDCIKLTDYGLKMEGKAQKPKRANVLLKKDNINYIINAYTSPEELNAILNKKPCLLNGKTDSWNCGILLYEMLTKFENPFKGKNNEEFIKAILNAQIDLEPIKDPFCKELISKLVRKNPEERIDIDEVLNMDYIKNVDIEQPEIDFSDNIINPIDEQEFLKNMTKNTQNPESNPNAVGQNVPNSSQESSAKNQQYKKEITNLKSENEGLKQLVEDLRKKVGSTDRKRQASKHSKLKSMVIDIGSEIVADQGEQNDNVEKKEVKEGNDGPNLDDILNGDEDVKEKNDNNDVKKSIKQEIIEEEDDDEDEDFSDKEEEFNEWVKLADVDLSLGDFNAYIHCASKILDKLEKLSNTDTIENLNEKKLQIYSNIAKYLYDYNPARTLKIANETLKNLEKSSDKESTILLCNKMINGALNVGNYDHALELTHKVLSLLPASSINPSSENYNPYFFLMSLIHIQILFNVGAFADCIDIGYRVLNVVNNDTLEILKPEHLSLEQFKEMIIDSVGYILLANIVLLTGKSQEFLNIIKNEFTDIPKNFEIFIQLENLIFGKEVVLTDIEENEYDKFGTYIYFIIKAITELDSNYDSFAQTVYEAKIAARQNGIYQLELFADVLISYAYIEMNIYVKKWKIAVCKAGRMAPFGQEHGDTGARLSSAANHGTVLSRRIRGERVVYADQRHPESRIRQEQTPEAHSRRPCQIVD